MNKSHQSFAVGAVLSLLLVACSGGGGGSSTPAAAVFAYVAEYGSNTVSAYRITAGTGALTRIDCGGGAGCSGSDFTAGTNPYSVTTTR